MFQGLLKPDDGGTTVPVIADYGGEKRAWETAGRMPPLVVLSKCGSRCALIGPDESLSPGSRHRTQSQTTDISPRFPSYHLARCVQSRFWPWLHRLWKRASLDTNDEAGGQTMTVSIQVGEQRSAGAMGRGSSLLTESVWPTRPDVPVSLCAVCSYAFPQRWVVRTQF